MRAVNINGIGMTSQRTRTRLIQRLITQGIRSADVLDAIQMTPRHLFVDEAFAHSAYEDKALPIGYNQTISKPYIVARMTEALLADGPVHKVLEIGTGSGYQTAILSNLVKSVYSVERIKALHEKARSQLRKLSILNTQLKMCDGSAGWATVGPFDGIIVTAAPISIPAELLNQLSSTGGRMVIPVGDAGLQKLVIVIRNDNKYRKYILEPVRFVPMLSGIIR
ncbi:MAG: protein-L-isoaspartate(D-aspartate) O-methyltransferase [Candidatus Endonucleobacter sp. (ex Gigantidas childressi)]|nr:protein-L-isoaspartate(D-aspartate) O-methyltransferase [Candidatus Endonucleobacter sp. (ex Gigantidas childressi)]